MAKKKRTCGKCGGAGHYKTTCKKKAKKPRITRKKKATKKKKKKKIIKKKKATKKKTKKTVRRPMSSAAKVKRWGKIVARHNSRTSDAKYQVRKKGNTYSCNCPGWVFKKKGKSRSCRHIKAAQAAGKKSRKTRRRRVRR